MKGYRTLDDCFMFAEPAAARCESQGRAAAFLRDPLAEEA